jgi:hypothetical protein
LRRLALVLGGPTTSFPFSSLTVSATSTVPAAKSTRERRSAASSPMGHRPSGTDQPAERAWRQSSRFSKTIDLRS